MALPLFPEQIDAAPQVGKRPIAVIGAGFSGTIAALQLLRRLPADQPYCSVNGRPILHAGSLTRPAITTICLTSAQPT